MMSVIINGIKLTPNKKLGPVSVSSFWMIVKGVRLPITNQQYTILNNIGCYFFNNGDKLFSYGGSKNNYALFEVDQRIAEQLQSYVNRRSSWL